MRIVCAAKFDNFYERREKMEAKKILTIWVFVLTLVLASNAHGKIILTADNQDVSSITLEVGQSCTVEVVSSDSTPYEAYIGFYGAPIIGDFSPLEIKPEAGKGAAVDRYSTPGFRGYYVKTGSGFPPPSPGVHFVFQFEAQEVGETDITLFDETLKLVLDSLHITVIPAAMGTGFTYQGRLIHDNNPTDGLYDFEFKLYDSPVGGNQLAGTIDINDLEIIDGYFTVELDFNDANVFNGDARWLDIAVRPDDISSFTTLSPRQQLTPTPYAIYAANAGADSDWMVSGDDMYSIPSGNVGIGTTSPEETLHVQQDTEGVIKVGTATGNGNATIIFEEGNDDAMALRYDGGLNVLKIDDETTANTRMIIERSSGYVGIGTTDPETRLEIRGDGSSWRRGFLCIKNDDADAGIRLYDSDTTVRHHLFNDNDNNDILRIAPAGSFGSGGITIAQDGSVGIGTDSPTETLTVDGKIEAEEIEVVASIADYVFDDNYSRMSLEELEQYIQEHHHLPGIASEKEVAQRGGTISVGASYTQLLEKVEELTLYIIEQNKKIKELQDVINIKLVADTEKKETNNDENK